MSTTSSMPAGFNQGENPKERPDLWTTFVCVCENEVVTFFQFANSVSAAEIAAFQTGVQMIQVPTEQPIPSRGSVWNGTTFETPTE